MSGTATEHWVAGMLAPATAAAPAPPERPVEAMLEGPSDGPQPEAPREELPRRCVTFRVEGEVYALDVMRVREVLRSAEIVPVPGAPASVLGIINLRGSIVPVIDARLRLGLPAAESEAASRVLVMESERQPVGLRVDGVSEVIRLSADSYETTPRVAEGESAPFIRGVAQGQDGFIVLVDVDRLLPSRVAAGIPG